MSIILALLTAAVLIAVGLFRSRRPQEGVEQVLVKRYVHPGHGWLRMTEDGDVLVGMDEFSESLIGSIETVTLPRLLKRVEQGGVAWTVRHGERQLAMVSPVSGRVVEKNEMVLANPSLINTSPYGDGWLFRVRPRKLPMQLHNLLTGRSAQEWQDTVRSRLSRFFSAGTPALLYQDGGVLFRNLSERCSAEEWSKISKEFFLVDDQHLQS